MVPGLESLFVNPWEFFVFVASKNVYNWQWECCSTYYLVTKAVITHFMSLLDYPAGMYPNTIFHHASLSFHLYQFISVQQLWFHLKCKPYSTTHRSLTVTFFYISTKIFYKIFFCSTCYIRSIGVSLFEGLWNFRRMQSRSRIFEYELLTFFESIGTNFNRIFSTS